MGYLEGEPFSPLSGDAESPTESNYALANHIQKALTNVIADQLTRRNAVEPTRYQRFLHFWKRGNEIVPQEDLLSEFANYKDPNNTIDDVKRRLNLELEPYGLRIVRVSGYRIEPTIKKEDDD
jgi:DNA-binding response OmpR family regulator